MLCQRTQPNGKGFPLEYLRPLAEEIGVNGKAFKDYLGSGQFATRVQQDINNGVSIGVSGTPAAFLLSNSGEIRLVADELTNGLSV